jgi:hypothetical protein
MIYTPIELTAADLAANFNADLAAIIAAKGLGGLGLVTTATIYPRMDADIFAGITPEPGSTNLPGIGVYAVPTATTQAKNQGLRDATIRIAFDYFARRVRDPAAGIGVDAALLLKQAELAVEAILLEVDRMYGLNSGAPNFYGIIEAGKDLRSVTVDIGPPVAAKGGDYYEERAIVIVPTEARDAGL